ncbi:MAG: TonB-dependent siderophore receptor [Burkholderiaceae bacterium]
MAGCVTAVLAAWPCGVALAQDGSEQKSLTAVEVTPTYDLDDVRPEGVTTATRTYLAPRDIPQTIDTLEVNKYKSYGINDLSIMLDGVPGVSTQYDMRGEGVKIRGFAADESDIYRDGVRESGQVRRSTANVERIEILKGPASVLYGRSAGGGIINLVSKHARFDARSNVSLRAGSWDNYGGTVDINRVLNRHVAMRLTLDREQARSFRSGISNRNEMVSPSIMVDTRTGLRWIGQYTWDTVHRVPDRGPAYDQLPAGVSIRQGFQHPGDYVEDRLRVLRSDLSYDFDPSWRVRWVASKRQADQDFDHFYAGTYCDANGRTSTGTACAWSGQIRPNYAWQQTRNETLNNTVDLTGRFATFGVQHDLLVGMELSDEQRHPRLASGASSFTYDPLLPIPWPAKPAQGAPTQYNLHEAKSRAIYLQDLIAFGEHWKALVGLRYERFEFRSTNQLTGASRSYDDGNPSPRIGVIWQPVREHSIYASWSKSFSPYGGRGLLSVDTSSTAVYDADPQFSRQIELGVKSDWLQGGLSTQVALYELEHYNIRYRPDPVNDPFNWAVRGAERSRGIEFSAAGRLARHWYVRGGVSLMSAKVVDDAGTPANAGKYLMNTAKRNGNLFVRYAPASDWYGEVGVTYTSARYLNAANTSVLPGYVRWDALLGWRNKAWTVTAAISNLLDREYWRSPAMPGAPRSFLVSANFQF